MNFVPYVPKSPTAIVTTVTPSPFSVVAICLAFAACAWSGTGSAMMDRHVVAPDIGLSGVHGTPSVMITATLIPAGRPVVLSTVCACSSASPVYVHP